MEDTKNFLRISLQFFAKKPGSDASNGSGHPGSDNPADSGDNANQNGGQGDGGSTNAGSEAPPSKPTASASSPTPPTPLQRRTSAVAKESKDGNDLILDGGASSARSNASAGQNQRGEERDTSGGRNDPNRIFIKPRQGEGLRNTVPEVSVQLPATDIAALDDEMRSHGAFIPTDGYLVEAAQRTRVNGVDGSDITFHMAGGDVSRDVAVPVFGLVNRRIPSAVQGLAWFKDTTKTPGLKGTAPDGMNKNYLLREMSVKYSIVDGDVVVEPGYEGGDYFKVEEFEIDPSVTAREQMDDVVTAAVNEADYFVDKITTDLSEHAETGSPFSTDSTDRNSAICFANMILTNMKETGASIYEAINTYSLAYGHGLNNLTRNGQRHMTTAEELLCGAFAGAASTAAFAERDSHFTSWKKAKYANALAMPTLLLAYETDKKFAEFDALFWQSRGPAMPLETRPWMYKSTNGEDANDQFIWVPEHFVKDRVVSRTYSYLDVNGVSEFGVSTLMFDDGHQMVYTSNPNHWVGNNARLLTSTFKKTKSGDSATVPLCHPLWESIIKWFNSDKKYQIADLLGVKEDKSVTIKIPTTMTVSSLSTWSRILLEASRHANEIIKTKIMETIFHDYWLKIGSPFKGVSVEGEAGTVKASKWLDIGAAINVKPETYSQETLTSPPRPGSVSGGVRLSWVMPETFKQVGRIDPGIALERPLVRHPWYDTPWNYVMDRTAGLSGRSASISSEVYIPLPIFNSQSRRPQADALRGVTITDVLSLNRMLDLNTKPNGAFLSKRAMYVASYTNSRLDAGFADSVVLNKEDYEGMYTLNWFLSRPRSKPYRAFVLPGGVATPHLTRAGGSVSDYSSVFMTSEQMNATGFILDNTSYKMRFWHPAKNRKPSELLRSHSYVEASELSLALMVWDAVQASRFATGRSTRYPISVFPDTDADVVSACWGQYTNPMEMKSAVPTDNDLGKLRDVVDYYGEYDLSSVPSGFTGKLYSQRRFATYEYLRDFCMPFALSPFDSFMSEAVTADQLQSEGAHYIVDDKWLRDNGFAGWIPVDITAVITEFARRCESAGVSYLRGVVSLKDTYESFPGAKKALEK